MDKERNDIMDIGYIRASSTDQKTLRQEVLMTELGVEQIFIDKCSGKNADRPQLKALFEFVRKGDTVIVSEISRFARNTKDLLNLIEKLTEKEVAFVSKKETIDTTTPTGKFMLTVFGAVAELERSYILSRQKEGIEAMKMDATKWATYGRPKAKLPDNFLEINQKVIAGRLRPTDAIKILGMKKSTFYKYQKIIKERNQVLPNT